jgi:hypothetical protein
MKKCVKVYVNIYIQKDGITQESRKTDLSVCVIPGYNEKVQTRVAEKNALLAMSDRLKEFAEIL